MRKRVFLGVVLTLLAAASASARMDYRLGIVHGGHFDLFEKAGIGWTRIDFTRNGIERKRGRYDWTSQDQQVAEAAAHGVKLMPILDYNAAWEPENKGPATEQERAGFVAYVTATVKHFAGRIGAWELWNEPNIGFWKPEPNARDYTLLLKEVYQAIKRVDPEARVVAGAFAGYGADFLREMCQYGAADYMDVISIHPYRYGNNPEIKFIERLEEVRQVLAQYGKGDLPIWITEIGWGSSGKGRSQADQANYFLRSYLTSLAGGIQVYMWFNFIDDPRYNSPVFPAGAQMVEKPVMRALRACTDLLADAECLGRMPWPDPLYGVVFRGRENVIVAAWRRYGVGEVPLTGVIEVVDQYGRPVTRDEKVASEQVHYFLLPPDSPVLAQTSRTAITEPTFGVAPPVKWSYHNEKAWYSSPAVGDVNGDGRQEVVIASGEQYALLCFSADGRELWRVKAEHSIPSSPVLADLDGDGKLEALIGTNDKSLWAVDGAGRIVWKAPLEGQVGDSAAAAADLDGGGKPEIVVGAESIVYCFDAQGRERWRYTMTALRDQKEAPRCEAPVAIGDVNGDSKPEIVVPATDGTVRCLDADGRELWRVMETGEPCRTGPVLGDLDGDGINEILVVLDARNLHCLTGVDGQELWRFPAGDRAFATLALGDVNGDGKVEVLFTDYGERLYCLGPDGRLLWQWNTFGKMRAAPVLADVDSDGAIEVLVGDGQGWFTCLDSAGRPKWRFTTKNDNEILESAAIADLDGDGKLEVVFGCKQGDLECLSLPGALDRNLMPWPARRADPAGTGALPQASPPR